MHLKISGFHYWSQELMYVIYTNCRKGDFFLPLTYVRLQGFFYYAGLMSIKNKNCTITRMNIWFEQIVITQKLKK